MTPQNPTGNTITIPSGSPKISDSLNYAASAAGAAARALFSAQNSVVDPKTGTGPTQVQTDLANELNSLVEYFQSQAEAAAAQGC